MTGQLNRLLFLALAILVSVVRGSNPAPPNIVFIVADDLGWNDVGYNNPHIISPNIDSLAKSGVVLDQNYVQPLCSPSRSALMTGVYPFRLGLQHMVIVAGQAVCVPFDRFFLPVELKNKGYKTHMVGKWHLGFCKWECTPTYRGFDSFFGYYTSHETYTTKLHAGSYDFRNNVNVDKTVATNYSSFQYAERIKNIISDHDPQSPLFLYLPMQHVHEPMEVPEEYTDLYPNINDTTRRLMAGMVTAMDDVVGQTVKSLKEKGIYDNTLIVFTADNGGHTDFGGNNYPLRGGKFTIFEGGTRAFSFVHGPMFKNPGTKYENIMHIVDWLPTLAEAAGIDTKYTDIDGVSQWQALLDSSKPGARDEVVYNLDFSLLPLQGKAAIRVGDYKLVEGFPGLYQSWYKPAGESNSSTTGQARSSSMPNVDLTAMLNSLDLSVTEDFFEKEYIGEEKYEYLFNLKDDPTEHHNLYTEKPEVVKQLKTRMQYHIDRMVKANFPMLDPKSDPDNWGGAWSPGWC